MMPVLTGGSCSRRVGVVRHHSVGSDRDAKKIPTRYSDFNWSGRVDLKSPPTIGAVKHARTAKNKWISDPPPLTGSDRK
jgi:hypothetical protein